MPRILLTIVTLCLLVPLAGTATAAWFSAVEGAGYFDFTCDAVNLARDDGSVDVVVLISVPHRELTFAEDAGIYRARVRATATVTGTRTGLDETSVEAVKTHRLSSRNRSEAESPALSQVFLVVVPKVSLRSGRLTVRVEDLNRRRPGLQYLGTDERAFAEADADWVSLPRRETSGLAIGDPVFMRHAPIRAWELDGRPTPAGGGGPWDYVNPTRRYGLEAEALQVYFTIEPPQGPADRARAADRPLLVRIESDVLDFALVDTIVTTAAVRRALADGRTAAVYWEMDAGGLPPGSFRFGLAPLDQVGRGVLASFDVVWNLQQLVRSRDDLLGEGRTVLLGDALRAFEDASPAAKEQQLDAFWADHDPTPDDGYNEARAEFNARVNYVKNFLGGFGPNGAADPRGRVYLLLGRPDSVREEAVPMNERSIEAARVMVFERFAVIADGTEGSEAWGGASDYTDSNPNTAGAAVGFVPYSYMADLLAVKNRTSDNSRSFLFWSYAESGNQLFLNSYSGQGGGLRFLFVDETGLGDYKLDSSNTRMPGN
ncbi:MAG: GWxTD domain-containing protein [Candidatus Krumholzibacteriia bacterium]